MSAARMFINHDEIARRLHARLTAAAAARCERPVDVLPQCDVFLPVANGKVVPGEPAATKRAALKTAHLAARYAP